jgi:hypothetical protein
MHPYWPQERKKFAPKGVIYPIYAFLTLARLGFWRLAGQIGWIHLKKAP